MWPFGKHRTPDPEEALRHRIVHLNGDINDATAQVVISHLLFLQHEDAQRPITLHIDSIGGILTSGMAIVDTVRGLQPPVHTWAPRVAYGVAAVVLASGYRGERVVSPTAKLSLTTIEGAVGWHPEVDRIRHKIADVIAELCGQHPDVVYQHLLTGRFFTASEAIAYGLADRVGE